ncbi:MAG: efflux RND transporter periplasmic adaptor subunit [gamma proteobacterium symbiont of Taylorina sp.]|nr:efflux RND transporter periplasmic adaptor subunit [gamma proteobacterium symbiont of Taylorina sp.]
MKWFIFAAMSVTLIYGGYTYKQEITAYYDQLQAGTSIVKFTETALEHAEKHLDPSYICPMHGQIIKNEPGTCPICGMDLVAQHQELLESGNREKKILYWVAPMDANYRRDKPGQSPMGMDLVPVYAEDENMEADVVKINPAVQQNIGVKTIQVQRGNIWRKIKTVGYVDYDEDAISHIHLRTEGWVEKLQVRAIGDRVKKNQLLMSIYSPELIRAQQDFVRVLSSDGSVLGRAAERNLKALGMSHRQIEQLRQSKKVTQTINIYAPQDGVIKRMGARDGMYVTPNNELMSLVNLSSVWIQTNIFESQSGWIKEGQDMKAVLNAYPQQQWQGKVDYIYPELDPVTRSLKVRLRVPNEDQKLKKNMYAEISIDAGQLKNVLIIPKQAVIRDGKEERVIVALGDGKFRARIINTGAEIEDKIVVTSGLKEDEEIVTSAQFLIDSEASLKASFSRME